MRGVTLLAWVVTALVVSAVVGASAVRAQSQSGTSVEVGDGHVEFGAWLEVVVPGHESPGNGGGAGGSPPPCRYRRGGFAELNAWLNNDYLLVPDPAEEYVFKLCRADGALELATFWVYRPPAPAEPAPPTVVDTTRLRNEAWGRLDIPRPTTRTAPAEVTVVHVPTYVWVPAAERVPVTETVRTTLNGQELRLTATASPRRLGFLRVDFGDGTTRWCDAANVLAFDHARDPLDQPSRCLHHYRRSSLNSPELRYSLVVTAYWDVAVTCEYDGGPCPNPPPAVPTQVLTAAPHSLAVAEIQALARPG
ncbi:hypothetical protein [Candidatus Poriferisocius sp.]|uniref:hypothetical protein n=1 Tax=Candidatus Poriferisocius sp. TaxID=3101276 RepID=UPI003B59C914